jgi:hypothetical protein
MELRDLIRLSAQKKIFYSRHALDQMSNPDRLITRLEVETVIQEIDIIEDYLDDPRGHSCLLAGREDLGRMIHVVCAPKKDYLVIVTAYLPNPEEWESDLKTRKKN